MKTICDGENCRIDCDGEIHYIIAKACCYEDEKVIDTTPCICVAEE